MRHIARICLVAITLVGCVGCDQVSKSIARAYLAPGAGYSFWHDTFRLVRTDNAGAFLSLGDAMPEQARTIIFTGVVGLLSAGALLGALCAPGLARRQVAALSLVAAGGIGNWIDRLTRHGLVTDFLNVGVGPLRTGIFNVADMILMGGLVLLVSARMRPAASNRR